MNTIKISKLTHRALELSILKWTLVYQGKILEHGPLNCMLCHLFWKKHDILDCFTASGHPCPIRQDTQHATCVGTPYDDLTEFYDDLTEFEIDTGTKIKDELDYLKGLLSRCEIDNSLPCTEHDLSQLEKEWVIAAIKSVAPAFKGYISYAGGLPIPGISALLNAEPAYNLPD